MLEKHDRACDGPTNGIGPASPARSYTKAFTSYSTGATIPLR